MYRFQTLTVLTVATLLSADLMSQDKPLRNGFVRASQIAGTAIVGAENQNLGTIEDVVLDKDAGTIAFAIVSFGPALNTEDKLFAVPWVSLAASSDAKALVLATPKDRLEKAPGFAKNDWPDMNAQWMTDVHTFYGSRAVPVVPVTPSRETVQTEQSRGDDRNRPVGENGQRENGHRDVTVVTGKVKSFQQGDPAQVMITSDTGEVRAELAPTAFLDQQRLVFDPSSDITVRGYETTRDGARTFVVTEVTAMDGRSVKLRGDDMAPIWLATKPSVVEKSTVATGVQEIRDVTGTVTYVEGGGACGESPQGRLVTLRTDRGDRVVALGPGSYLSKNRWDLRASETISVKGYEADHNGSRVFYATEVRKGNETWKLRRADGTPLW